MPSKTIDLKREEASSTKPFFAEIKLFSKQEIELIDITERVKQAVERSGKKDGVVVVFSEHTTGAIRIGEYEKGLVRDTEAFLARIAPKGKGYKHDSTNVDGRRNAHSHLLSLFMPSSEHIPLRDGELLLGNWQTIFFVELDGPRQNRKVIIEVFGE